MRNWYHKNFNKKRIAIAFVFDDLGRMEEHVVFPDRKENTIKIGAMSYTYDIGSVYWNKGIPNLVYRKQSVHPINLKADAPLDSSPLELQKILENKIVSELLTEEGGTKEQLLFWITIGAAGLAGAACYLIYQQGDTLAEILFLLREAASAH